MQNKVSIVTPCYNSEKTINQTYKSICEQSYEHWEWLVTDDRSTDDTYRILQDLAKEDFRIRVFQNKKNSGTAVSRNKSLSEATGDFIAFIDSDDIWKKHKLSTQLKFMQSNNVDFSFTAYELVGKNSEALGKNVDTHLVGPISYSDMLRKKATLGCSTVMLRAEAFNDIRMPNLRTGQDYALWLKLLKTGKHAQPITQVLTQYRIMPNSISRNKFHKAKRQWQIYREIEGLNFILACECFTYYAYRAVFKK